MRHEHYGFSPEVGKEKKDDKVNRRDFMKKAGKILGGALIAGSAAKQAYEVVEPILRKQEIEAHMFSIEKLKREIHEIQNENPRDWEGVVRERIRKGIEVLLQKQVQFVQKSPESSLPMRGLDHGDRGRTN